MLTELHNVLFIVIMQHTNILGVQNLHFDFNNITYTHLHCGLGRSRYSDLLRAGRFGDRILVGARFSAFVQAGPAAHPAFYTMDTGSFPGVKRPGRGVNHPPPSSGEVKERVQLCLFLLWIFMAYSGTSLTFTIPLEFHILFLYSIHTLLDLQNFKHAV